jgi:hypothetical protein
VGADVFFGLSSGGAVTPEMVKTMAPNPDHLRAGQSRPRDRLRRGAGRAPDAIVATGRSDFPNQINNVLGFPFIFRGALDVRATTINDEMKLAATRALASLAKEDVPDSVLRAYGVDRMEFGREYIIPKPFDPRVLIWEASAVAQAAMETGVAQQPVDLDQYREELERRLGRANEVMRAMIHKAQQAAQADRLHRRRAGQDPARLPDSARRKDRPPDPARAIEGRFSARAGTAPAPDGARWSIRHLPAPGRVPRGVLQPAAAQGHHPHRSRPDHPQPGHLRQPDGAAGRRRRADRRLDHALSRHHPAGACR